VAHEIEIPNPAIPPVPPTVTKDIYVYKGEVMIWSAGPDMELNVGNLSLPFNVVDGSAEKANEGKNEDNILSWQ
jgi:hypothetical protein